MDALTHPTGKGDGEEPEAPTEPGTVPSSVRSPDRHVSSDPLCGGVLAGDDGSASDCMSEPDHQFQMRRSPPPTEPALVALGRLSP